MYIRVMAYPAQLKLCKRDIIMIFKRWHSNGNIRRKVCIVAVKSNKVRSGIHPCVLANNQEAQKNPKNMEFE